MQPCLVVKVDEGDEIRHDICSDDMRRVHPDLPSGGTPKEREFHMIKCDLRAYSFVRERFPALTPPSFPVKAETR